MDQIEITGLIQQASAGDREAHQKLFAQTYRNLKRIASGQIRRVGNQLTINPSTLVHEAYLKYARHDGASLVGGAHFYNLLGQVMRQILIDLAKKHSTMKHGAALSRTELGEEIAGEQLPLGALLDIDSGLRELERCDPDLAQIFEWHFFAGLSFLEMANAQGVSERTIRRYWLAARAFLLEHIGEEQSGFSDPD